jgi:trimeric autotransporter adhesin
MPASSTRRATAGVLWLLSMLAACGGGDGATGPGPVARVEASIGNITLNTIGGSQPVTAVARDASGTTVPTATIAWSSDDATIASVTANGNAATITAVGPGATVIRARVGTIGADITVQVFGVRAIQVSPTNASIRAGDSQPFSAAFDADPGVSTAVTWTSADNAIATVNTAGLVTGVAPGTTTIRATSVADPRRTATGAITVTPARGVSIAPTSANLATNEQRTLLATVAIEAGLSTAVTWRTSAPAVATVSQTGVVRGVAFGTTTITAVAVADTMLKGTATINVVPVVRSVTVSPTTASLFINLTQQLTSTVVAEGSLPTTVTWASSNPNVATVSSTGLVTAIGVGSATITVISTADLSKSATATITVAPRPISVAITQRVVGLNPGTSTTLTAVVDADPGISRAVTWNSATPSVATISAAGVVSALAGGTTLITATSQADNTKRDTVTVTVVPRLATNWSSTRLNGVLYDDLISIVAFNNFSAFAINSINGGTGGGDIYRYDGTNWVVSASASVFGTRFLSVQGLANNDMMAVGTNGVIARWNGTAWTPMTSGTTRTLRSVWMEDANTAYAVGDNGTALRWNGTTWSALNTASTTQLNGVWGSGLRVIMVGNSGEVLRYNGTSVIRETVPIADDLNAVGGVVGGIITVVGDFGGVLRYDGTTWTLVNSNGIIDDFFSVSGNGGNGGRMYIGGSDGVYELNGTTLTSAAASYPVTALDVHVDVSGSVWAAGQRGSIQRLTGTTWTTLNFAPDLLDVWTTSSSNAWAVGEYGFVYRWNGLEWARQTTPSLANLYSVWGASASDAFAGGDNGTMLRWNGTNWSAMTFPSTARVFAIWGSSVSNVFAVTDVGEILRYNGTSWALQTTSPGSKTLLAVYGVSANEVYATGTDGLVMRYNGTSWSTFTAPDAVTTLFGVWMSGSSNILSVGANVDGTAGFGFGYNGTSWAPLSLGSPAALTSIWGASVFDVYATGDRGTILRFNGASWQPMSAGTTDLLWSISGAPDASGGAFAVGYNTTIVTGSNAAAASFSARGRLLTRSLEPSVAARNDRKASGAAARGPARRNRAALARTTVTRNQAARGRE